MFTNMSILKKKLRGVAWRIFNIIENNGVADFKKNGEKIFIKNLIKNLKKYNKEVCFFDIGANIGEYSAMLNAYSKIYNLDINMHLFEPTKMCFEHLVKRFSGERGVFLNNFGVSDEECLTKIFYDDVKSTLASLYKRNLKHYNIKLNNFEDIILKRMDYYIEDKKINHIDFVKIDVEGHELKVLLGFGKYLNNNFIDFIQFEYGGANLDSHSSLMDIYEVFLDKQFVIAKVLPKGLEIRKYMPYMENFCYSNYVAISEEYLKKC